MASGIQFLNVPWVFTKGQKTSDNAKSSFWTLLGSGSTKSVWSYLESSNFMFFLTILGSFIYFFDLIDASSSDISEYVFGSAVFRQDLREDSSF